MSDELRQAVNLSLVTRHLSLLLSMQKKLLEVLACPKCRGALDCAADEVSADGEIMAGSLRRADCGAEYAISAGIPRFVPHVNYAASFGYQWNLFRREQIDSVNGTNLSARRFYA